MKALLYSLKYTKKALFIVVISMLSYSAMAQWELVMQEGGNIYSQIEYNNAMYTGTYFGVFKSDDGGITWFEMNEGLTNTVVHPMLSNDSRLFAGTEAGVFISDDDGESWTESNQGVTISKINCFLLSEDGIYAGTDDQGVMYSTDNGDSWSLKNTGLSNLEVKTMLLHNDRLFAGTNGAGVFYSDDDGNTWTQNNNGLNSWFIHHLTSKDDKLFVSTDYHFCISENNGQSWNALSTPFEHIVLSADNSGDYMFVGTDGDGVAYTTDYGQTWTMWSEGLTNKNMYTMEVFDDYVWSACCCGFGLFKRLLPEITSIESLTLQNEIQIYPNPAYDIINIKSKQAIQSILIYNQHGQLVLTERGKKGRINVSQLNAGMYICRIQTEEGLYSRRLIIH